MVKLPHRTIAAALASVIAGSVYASPPSPDPASEPGPPTDSVAALAAAYWSDRAGRLPPNRPVTVRPVPQRSRHTPPPRGRGGRHPSPTITLPGSGRR